MRRRSVGIGSAVVAALVAVAGSTAIPAPPSFVGTSSESTDAVADRAIDTAAPSHLPSPNRVRETRVPDFARASALHLGDSIVVANLTVTPGRYLVSYAFDAALTTTTTVPTQLRCGLVDANGVDRFIATDPALITTGRGWQRMMVVAVFSLPDVTLGVRCEPTSPGLVLAHFRDIWLAAIKMAD